MAEETKIESAPQAEPAAEKEVKKEEKKKKAAAKKEELKTKAMNGLIFRPADVRKSLCVAGCDAALFETLPNLDAACAEVLEYFMAEVLEISSAWALKQKRMGIKAFDVYRAVLDDPEMTKVLVINDIHGHPQPARSYERELRAVMLTINDDHRLRAEGVATMSKVCALALEKMAQALREIRVNGRSTAEVAQEMCAKVLVGELIQHAAAKAALPRIPPEKKVAKPRAPKQNKKEQPPQNKEEQPPQ